MAQVTLKGNAIHTIGELPAVGSKAPDFALVSADLSTKSMADFKGQNIILNIFPSVDTGTCALSVKAFNKAASELDNTTVVCVSKDLPFAFGRFCGAEGIDKVVTTSDFRDGSFGESYGVTFKDGPLQGLLSRSIVVVNASGEVIYTEQVAETADEPNYQKALASLK